MKAANQLQRSRLLLVTLGHFLNDSYGSFFAPILPVLIEKLPVADPHTIERLRMYVGLFVSKGFDQVDAQAKALKLLDGGVSLQSLVMAFDDTFVATIVLVLVTLPLAFLLGKPQEGVKVEAGH